MSEVKEKKHAVVLSGGGAYGAYEVGVLKALLTGQSPTTGFEPLVPEIITGTSVGAYTGAFLTSRLAAGGAFAAAELERVWRQRIAQGPGECNNGVYRVRLDPQDFVTPGCYVPNPLEPFLETAQDTLFLAGQTAARTLSFFSTDGPPLTRAINELYLGAAFDTEPFRDLIRDTIDLEAVRRSQVDLHIFTTNWNTSAKRGFSNADLTDDVGDLAIQASGSLPTIFPPVPIGSEFFVDGGLVINTPFSPAINAGANVIHVIFLDPLVRNIPLRKPVATTAEIYRSLAILFAAQFRSQIVQIDLINRALRLLALAARGQTPSREDDRSFLRVAAQVRGRIAQQDPYNPLEIFAYRPSPEVLKGLLGFLDFDLHNIDTLIEAGFADAVNHPSRPETSDDTPLEGFL